MKPKKRQARPTRFRSIRKRGAAPANAGAVPPLPLPPLPFPLAAFAVVPGVSAFITVAPSIPGWPAATIRIVAIGTAIDTSSFWKTVSRPFVFRLVASRGMNREEIAAIEAGMFVFVVRPGREEADVKALSDALAAQGGPIPGDVLDMSGDDTNRIQIVAVLLDVPDAPDAPGNSDAGRGGAA